MERMLRRTGIDILGDCEWGAHFCVFYRTPQDLTEVLVPYFKAGLEDHEFCIWVTSQPLPVETAKQALQEAVPDLDRYLAAGQIEILDYSRWYMLAEGFNSERILQAWIDKVKDARRRGYAGLRLTGNTFWLEKDDWRAFTDYEAGINRVIGNYPMIALCSYSLDRCGASEVLDVVANHQFALARREGEWEELQSANRRRSTELRRASLYVRSLIEASLDPLVTISPAGVVTDVNQATEEVTGVDRGRLIGTDFSEYFTELDKARAGYRLVLSRGLVRDFPLTIRHASGRTIDVLYNATLYRNEAGAVEGVFAAARDITERKRAEQLSDARARQQAAISELGQLALAGVDVDRLMETTSALVTSTLGVEYCKVLELLPGGTAMLLRAGAGWEPGLVGSAIVPATANSQAGYVLQARQPVIVEDLRTETRFTGAPLLHDHAVVSGISVLIAGPNDPFGVLGAHTAKRRAFTQDDINFLQATANVIATALQRRAAKEALRQAHAQLEARVEKRTRELAALLEVSRNVAAEVVLDPLLATILDQLKTVVDYTGAGIMAPEGDSLKWAGYNGVSLLGSAAQKPIPLDRPSPFQQVAGSRRPLVIGDVRRDEALDVAPAPDGAPVRSWLGVPLVARGELIGILTLDHREPEHFTEHHVRLASAFADHAAVAIQNARLYAQAQKLAALQERQRLARELHDSVSQSLYGIVLGAQTARMYLVNAPEKLNVPLDYIISLAGQAFADLRALIFEQGPDSRAAAGLLAGIMQQVELLQKHCRISVDMDLCDEPQASTETKEVLYRVAQEALSNVAKHARATNVTLGLACAEGALLLEVQDNGVGFDPRSPFPGHLGLRLMRERAEKLGGIFEITSSPGAGTRIRAQVPLLAPGATGP